MSLTTATFRPATRLALTPTLATALFSAATAAAALAGLLATPNAQTAHAIAIAGHEWATLLRAMAALKTLMAATALAATLWRLRAPTPPARLAAYTLAAGAMLAGPGLIWGLAHVGLGALLLHAGIAATLLLLWRDPAVAAGLAQRLAARRTR